MTTTPTPAQEQSQFTLLTYSEISKTIRAGHYPTVPTAITNLLGAEDHVRALDANLRTNRDSFAQFLNTTTETVCDGGELPHDFARAAQEALDAESHRETAQLAVRRIYDSIRERWHRAARDHADELLDGLRANLGTLLSQIKDAASQLEVLDLTDPDTIAGANDHQRAALANLKRLRIEHSRIREAQKVLIATCWETPPARDNFDATHRTWAQVWDTHLHEFRNVAHEPVTLPAGKINWFRPIADRDDAWLPTISEFRDAWAALRDKPAPIAPTKSKRPSLGNFDPGTAALLSVGAHNNSTTRTNR